MKRKGISLLLLAAMAVTVLAACGGEAGPETPAAETQPAVTSEEAVETTAPPEYTAPDVDYEGKEFKFSAWFTDSPNWVATSYCEAIPGEQNGDIINDAIYMRARDTEEALGVTIVGTPWKASADITKPALAGDHFADTVLVGGGTAKGLLNQNLLIDLKTIDTLDLSKSWWDQGSVDGFSIGGKLYFAAGEIGTFGNLAVFCSYYNKGMGENYNLENPYEMVRNGVWTIDKMREMATVVVRDVNGDGTMGKEDVFGYESEPGIGIVLLRSGGVKVTTKDKDDLPALTVNTERAASLVEKFVPLCRDKSITLYSQDFSSGYKNVFRQFITEKFIADELLFVNNWLCVALELRNMDSDFGILPPAKFDEQQDDYIVPSSESWTNYAAVLITETDTDFTGYVMDALGHFGKEHIYTALIETTITNKALRDTDTEEMLDIIYNKRSYDLAALYDWGGIYSLPNTLISDNSTDFASAVAKIEAKVTAAIQETIDALK